MRTEFRKFSTITLIAMMMASLATVFAVPQIPHLFYGTVTIDGVPAPDGYLVEAKIGGITYEAEYTVDGKYGYNPADLFHIPADDPDTPEIEGGVNGDTVEFYVNSLWAISHPFTIGGITMLSLEPTIPFEIFLYEGWNLIGLPMIPEDPSIEVVLSEIIDYIESVWTYDGYTKAWSSYAPGAPSDLTQIQAGKGYWIKTITDVVWNISVPGYYGSDQYTLFEKVEIKSVEVTPDAFGNWVIALTVKNSGTATATLESVYINNIACFNATTGAPGTAVPTITTDLTYSPAYQLTSGDEQTFTVWIGVNYGTLSSGTTINLKVHSASGMDYMRLIQLV